MAKNLKKKFGSDIGNTMRIARTEGARVLEDAKYEAFKSISENKNVQVFKIWRTMGDEAVRDSHVEMEGQKVLYDEEFVLPSGARCLYPKASGVPSEDINCRCYVEYVTETLYDKDVYEIANIYGYNPLEADKVVNVLRDDSKKWIDKLTDEEKRAINKYTYNGKDSDGKRLFEKINGYLEYRYSPSNEKEEEMLIRQINKINQGLLKNKLEHDIIVYRNDVEPESLNNPVKKFLSTSVTRKGTTRNIPNVAIIVPRGSNGAYVEELADEKFKKQREFLLNKNTVLKKICKKDDMLIYLVKGDLK